MHDSKRKRKRPLALLGGHHQKVPIEIEASAQACVEGFLLMGRNVLADQIEGQADFFRAISIANSTPANPGLNVVLP